MKGEGDQQDVLVDQGVGLEGSATPGSEKVYKSNMLIEANYKLNLVEHRILLACIAKLNPREAFPDEIELEAKDYAKIFGTPKNEAYKALLRGSEHLHERTLEVGGQFMRWLKGRVEYLEGEGRILVRFSAEVKPHLVSLRRCFTAYELEKVAPLQSTYSIRLYELCMQWRGRGKLFIRVEDFKKRLGLDDRYQAFRKLKEWVIAPAVEELQAKSALNRLLKFSSQS